MRPGDARVTPDWLRLREPADAAARAASLAAEAAGRMPAAGRLVIHDLGSGTGSMCRWLAPRLPAGGAGPGHEARQDEARQDEARQHWVLHDRDAGLLARAEAGLAGLPVTVETRVGDLTLLGRELRGAALVTASALLDMLTAEELDRVVASCVAAGCPALLTLSVTGEVELSPADPLDAPIGEAFNAHQQRTVAGRRLLGPAAPAAAVSAFTRLGSTVRTRPSPWRLGPAQAGLALAWLQGWVGAACEQDPGLAAAAGRYADRRRAQAAAGGLGVIVHHEDVLAWR